MNSIIRMACINYELQRDVAIDNCIRNILDDINSLRRVFGYEDPLMLYALEEAKDACRLMRILYLCGRKLGKGLVHFDSAFCTLEESIHKHSLEIQSVCLTLMETSDVFLTFRDNNVSLYNWVLRFLGQQEDAILGELVELHQVLSNVSLETFPNSDIELGDLLIIIDSLLDLCCPFLSTTDMKECLKFLKNFIRFVRLQGLGGKQMGGLLILARGLLVDVACFISWRIGHERHDNYEASKWSNIDELVNRIEPLESHVCEIYVRALQETSELSSSSNHLAPLDQFTALVLADFVDSLVFLLWQYLFRGTGYKYIFDNQVRRLYMGLRLLRTTLRKQVDKANESLETRHGLIGVWICEAGVTICYLFQGEKDRKTLYDKVELFSLDFLYLEKEEEVGPRCQLTSSAFPQTNFLGFLDSLLEKMKSSREAVNIASTKNEFNIIQDNLAYLRSFLVNVVGQNDQTGNLQALLSRIATVAYKTEFVLDSLVVGDTCQSFTLLIDSIASETKLIKTEALGSSPRKGRMIEFQRADTINNRKLSTSKIPEFDEPIVGLHDESQKIIERLIRGSKNLDVVSIVGMAGLGKTTLARKVYRDPSITIYFQVQIWCTISQVWNKRSLLLEILNNLGQKSVDMLSKMSEYDLGDTLRRYLKGKRYLVILDDVWDAELWSSLRISFPCDSTGSRILVTTRSENVALQIRQESKSHTLRFLTETESWELFQTKMCFEGGFPQQLITRGKAIATCCKGLPLMIVVVAGILSNMEPSAWEEIEECLKKGNLRATDECKEILELSYRHLPDYLKPCFLYFGAYKEDQNVRVCELLWLWIAEGFVKKTEKECEESVAESYLMELIQRNLVMVAERGSRGKVTTCVLHDLLHDLCREKGEQERFLHQTDFHELGVSPPSVMLYRLHVKPGKVEEFADSLLTFPYLRTLLIDDDSKKSQAAQWHGILYNFCQSRLLRIFVLNGNFEFSFFPSAIQLLGHLRYLAFALDQSVSIPPSIDSLSNLETLIVRGQNDILLPNSVWNMIKLRHMKAWLWELPMENPKHLSSLLNLHTLSRVTFSHGQTMEEVIRKLPNVRRLNCTLSLKEEEDGTLKSFTLDFLSQLESLTISRHWDDKCMYHFQFPPNLKKLTLHGLELPWSELSVIDRLPNLEVLKLLGQSFTGKTWHVGEEGTFPKLRFLKLECLDLVRWTMNSEDNVPCLEMLLLKRCEELEELPTDLAQSSTLQMIEVISCHLAANSMKEIEEIKTELGNDDLKIHYAESAPSESYSSEDETGLCIRPIEDAALIEVVEEEQ
ncbi:OLC1v1001037C2 [Oldenlandia corymbosa var. corymbosa]|uniref:OLC1v1001037C2 n=1 Tax=Oldenlandia corymbosa var. corymbosa TaxID=529605 RepID=A0AAV1D580_OLDCO|nr:OLC1v1001037C2 [Oldenlandia corymbosa var. corymbosa]